jgi:hypothetical protein
MQGKSWKSTIRGIRDFDTRSWFTTLHEERTSSSYRFGIRVAFFCLSPVGCWIRSHAQI